MADQEVSVHPKQDSLPKGGPPMLLTHFVACHAIHVTVFIALAPRRFLAADLDHMGANTDPAPGSLQVESSHTGQHRLKTLTQTQTASTA